MEPVFTRRDVTLYHGDCLDVLKSIPDCSVDSIVTDPPAGIGFMGKEWDDFRRARNEADSGRDDVFGRTSKTGPEYGRCDRENFIDFLAGVMKDCLRVLKPGGHAVVWSIPRTSHWTGTAMEDAGFEIRDVVLHLFGSGFPKSHNVSVAIDKEAGEQRERIRGVRSGVVKDTYAQDAWSKEFKDSVLSSEAITDAAKQWSGWGTALKPAAEFWWLCRKPLEGTVAANVQKWGTGGLNIDGCIIDAPDGIDGGRDFESSPMSKSPRVNPSVYGDQTAADYKPNPLGRWPANVTHDGSEEVLAEFPEAPGQIADVLPTAPSTTFKNCYGKMARYGEASAEKRYTDNGGTNFAPLPGQRRFDAGSAARFFYCPKASSSERGRSNDHPTVKPIELMRWLCRLVTPPDGTVLDCFAGSGSTLLAAREEGFKAIGIEREEKYIAIIKHRLSQDVLF